MEIMHRLWKIWLIVTRSPVQRFYLEITADLQQRGVWPLESRGGHFDYLQDIGVGGYFYLIMETWRYLFLESLCDRAE